MFPNDLEDMLLGMRRMPVAVKTARHEAGGMPKQMGKISTGDVIVAGKRSSSHNFPYPREAA